MADRPNDLRQTSQWGWRKSDGEPWAEINGTWHPLARPSFAANAILLVPSLTPEEGDEICALWYMPGAQYSEGDEDSLPVPADWQTLQSWTWTGSWENDIGARVLVMLPLESYPTTYAYVTANGFEPIELHAGSLVTVGCQGAGWMEGVSLWAAQGGQSDLVGGLDVLEYATEFRPVVGLSSHIGVDGAEGAFTGPLAGADEGDTVTEALWKLDQHAASVTSPVRKVAGIGYRTTIESAPAFAAYTGKWHSEEVLASVYPDGSSVYDITDAKLYTITAGDYDAGTAVSLGIFVVADGNFGGGLVYLQRSAAGYDGVWVNDTNEQQASLTMAQRNQPHYDWLNESLSVGDQTISLPDTAIDLRYALVQVWVDTGIDGRRMLGPNEFRVTSNNDILIIDAEAETSYRVVAWGWWYD